METHNEQVRHCFTANADLLPHRSSKLRFRSRSQTPGRGEPFEKCGTIVKTIRRRPQAAAIAIRPANVLMVGLTLGALLTVSNFVQTAKAQQSNTPREQVIRECNLMEKRDPRMIHMKGQRPVAGSSFTKAAWPITARGNDSD